MALSDVANVILSYAKNLQVQQCPFIAHRKLFHANADIVEKRLRRKIEVVCGREVTHPA